MSAGAGGAGPAGGGEGEAAYVVDAGTGQCRVLRLTHPRGGAVTLEELGELPLLRAAADAGALPEWAGALGTVVADAQRGDDGGAAPRGGRLTVACSAWYRALTEEQRAPYAAAFTAAEGVAERAGLRYATLLLDAEDEARCELAAVSYAASRVLGYEPDVVLSGGKGSSQVAAGGRVCSLPLTLADGEKEVGAGEPGRERWSGAVAAAAAAAGVSAWPAFPPRARVVAISGFFYGAKAAGLPTGAAAEPLTCAAACARLEAAAAEGTGKPQNIANWLRMRGIIAALPLPDPAAATVVFGRDWIVDGSAFRTTWAAGMFVSDRPRLL